LINDATRVSSSPNVHTGQPANIGRSLVSYDSSYLSSFQKKMPGESSADITEFSDAYLQSLVQLFNE
jgi:hypothetical protein